MSQVDERIGQISILPSQGNRCEIRETVLASCSQHRRRAVRKGLKVGFVVALSDDPGDLDLLHYHHVRRMQHIGGLAKSHDQLRLLKKVLGSACHLWTATLDGEFAGALLTLQYREWVEYFLPIAVEEYRSRHVLSALILEAMTESAIRGCRFWNWGGTWGTQQGVYRFKREWGATDHPYGYFGFAQVAAFAGAHPADLLRGYPLFYVMPFSSAASPGQAPAMLPARNHA